MRGGRLLLLLLLPEGLVTKPSCDRALQDTYCNAWYALNPWSFYLSFVLTPFSYLIRLAARYGGDYHTGCQYCGRGGQCPPGELTGRGIQDQDIR